MRPTSPGEVRDTDCFSQALLCTNRLPWGKAPHAFERLEAMGLAKGACAGDHWAVAEWMSRTVLRPWVPFSYEGLQVDCYCCYCGVGDSAAS
jgi:hypothetical protein